MSRSIRFQVSVKKAEADAERLLTLLRKKRNARRTLEARARALQRAGDKLKATVESLIRAVPRG